MGNRSGCATRGSGPDLDDDVLGQRLHALLAMVRGGAQHVQLRHVADDTAAWHVVGHRAIAVYPAGLPSRAKLVMSMKSNWSWERTVPSVNRPGGGTTSASARQRTPGARMR